MYWALRMQILQMLTSNGDGGGYSLHSLLKLHIIYAVNFQIHKVVCPLRHLNTTLHHYHCEGIQTSLLDVVQSIAEPPKTNAAICAQHPRLQAIHKTATGTTMHM